MATAKKKTSKKKTGRRVKRAPQDETVVKQEFVDKASSPERDEGPAFAGDAAPKQEMMLVDGEHVPAVMMENPEFAKYAIAKRIAHTLSTSSLVPEAYRGRAADCFIALQMGAEVGLGPFQAVQSIAVINGRPSIWGDALIGVVRASPLCEWIEETFDAETQTATCKAKRRGDPSAQSRSFSMADAVTAGIANKDIWKKYGPRMLQMRARSFCLRDLFPDLLKGLSVAEEIMDYHSSPAPIEAYTLPASPKSQTVAQPPTLPTNGKQATADDDPVTLAMVKKLISDSTTMEYLLKAGEAAKALTDADDIYQARLAYQQKRNLLVQFGSGIKDPAQQSSETGAK